MPYTDYTISMPIGAYVAVLEAILVVGGLALALYLLWDAGTGNRLVRRYLRFGLSRTRLGRMLARHRIGVDQYLDATPVPEVRRQLRECANCPHERLCDAAATCQPLRLDYGYCPNLPVVLRCLGTSALQV